MASTRENFASKFDGITKVSAVQTTTVAAEDAPIGQLLWPVTNPKFAPNFTLAEVQVIRNEIGTYVRWVYQGDVPTRTFKVGEQVVIAV